MTTHKQVLVNILKATADLDLEAATKQALQNTIKMIQDEIEHDLKREQLKIYQNAIYPEKKLA